MNGLENIGLRRLTNFPQRHRWTVLDQGGPKVAFAEGLGHRELLPKLRSACRGPGFANKTF
jgi:hypothetical protein